jgi:hypothetical protein
MAIKTSSDGSIPAVSLDYDHIVQFVLSVGMVKPYRKSISLKIRPYGKVNGDETRYFSEKNIPANIADIDAYIATKVPAERQAEAVAAMVKFQEAIGVLDSLLLNKDFIGVE